MLIEPGDFFRPSDAAIALDPSLGRPPRACGLACKQCHRVKFTSRVGRSEWHQIVQFLSGGLLHGCEVPRPGWFTPDRKRPFRPCLGRPPSRRLPQVEAMMRRGMTYAQMARELGLCESTVSVYAWKVFVRHGVHSLSEFRRKASVAVTIASSQSIIGLTRTAGQQPTESPG
jgi:hypothetical protein